MQAADKGMLSSGEFLWSYTAKEIPATSICSFKETCNVGRSFPAFAYRMPNANLRARIEKEEPSVQSSQNIRGKELKVATKSYRGRCDVRRSMIELDEKLISYHAKTGYKIAATCASG